MKTLVVRHMPEIMVLKQRQYPNTLMIISLLK